jgi:hypothetical protein
MKMPGRVGLCRGFISQLGGVIFRLLMTRLMIFLIICQKYINISLTSAGDEQKAFGSITFS